MNAGLIERHTVKVGQGATGFALKTGRKGAQCRSGSGLFLRAGRAGATLHGDRVGAAHRGGETVGAVTIYSCELAEYGEEHIRLLETISRIASDAIDKSLDHAEAQTQCDDRSDDRLAECTLRSQAQFDKEVARADRNDESFQLVMLDLDGFKAVNDNFGHKAGDQLLREVSKVIAGQLRDYDFLARYGGDEFVAIVPETKPEDVADLCMRIEKAVAAFELPFSDGESARVGVSPGSATYQRGFSFDQMIVAADKAMYMRKQYRKRARRPVMRRPLCRPAPQNRRPRVSSSSSTSRQWWSPVYTKEKICRKACRLLHRAPFIKSTLSISFITRSVSTSANDDPLIVLNVRTKACAPFGP